jgi:imidazolonepropionase-like amidohydrolase
MRVAARAASDAAARAASVAAARAASDAAARAASDAAAAPLASPARAVFAVLVTCVFAGAAPATARAQDVLVITNANVIDAVSAQPIANATIVIRDGRIERVERGAIAPPAGATILDLGGMYVAPGFIDTHVHITNFADAERALLAGVTTVRSSGSAFFQDVGMRELARAGIIDAPEFLAAGWHVRPNPGDAFFINQPEMADFRGNGVRGEDAMRRMAGIMADNGVDWVKVNATDRAGLPTTDPRNTLYGEAELRALVEAATARGMPVQAHAHGDAGARNAVLAGVRSIEHGTYLSEATLREMARRGTFLVPTIAIVGDLTGPGGDYDDALLQIRGRHMLPRVREMTAAAHRLGVRIVGATDTGYGPNSTVRMPHELIELVAAGLSPLEALQAATIVPAEMLGIAERTGRIAPGFEADLIVVERNPLADIANLQDVLVVVSNGRIVANRLGLGRPAT